MDCTLDDHGRFVGVQATGGGGQGGAGGSSNTTNSGGQGGVGGQAGGGAIGPGGGGSEAGGGGAGGAATGGGAAAGSGGSVIGCGNGIIEPPEVCDDGNAVLGDGCSGCMVDPGYTCELEPSLCTPIKPQQVVKGPGLGVAIADNASYKGTLASMDCFTLNVPDAGYTSIQNVELVVAMDHPYLGDLIIKVVSPANKIVTVLSRPGLNEPKDDYYEPNGDSSKLVTTDPIAFFDGAPTDAEAMGNSIGGNQAACRDDLLCEYAPNPGAGPGKGLADFAGDNPVGAWRVCFADGDDNDQGVIDVVALLILSW